MRTGQRDATSKGQKWTRQQEEEWLAFQAFQKDYPLPSGTVERSDKPDVVIHGDRKLGIEITSLHIADGRDAASEQRQVKPREHTVALAQEIHNKAGGRPIELVIGFDPGCPITDARAMAHAIAEVAAYVQRGAPGQVDQLTYEHLGCVDFMYLSGEYANPRWKVQQGYYVPMLRVDRVKEIVSEKVEKAREYRPCDALWLVITVDFWDPAQDQDIEWPEGERIVCGPYDRVFLHKAAYRHVVEVQRA